MNKLPLQTFVFFIFLVVSSVAYAAEMRGRLTGIQGATVRVTCDGIDRSASIGTDGSFAISGLPTQKSCSFTVSSVNASSAPIPFSTTRSVTIFNGRLKRQNEIILVIRQ